MRKKVILILAVVLVVLIGLYAIIAGNRESTSAPEVTEVAETSKPDYAEKNDVILDDKYITITYKGVELDGTFGDSIVVEVTNKTDKDIVVSYDATATVNNKTVSLLASTDVYAGTSAVDDLDLFEEDLDKAGIAFEDIEVFKTKITVYYNDFEDAYERNIPITINVK